jgi:hypothetical protein
MNEGDAPKPAGEGEGSGQINQRIQHSPVTARVPDRVARGVFSTGVIVIDGPYEFVLDFVMGLVQPRQVVARVILTPVVMEQFVAVIRDNVAKFEARFGKISELPKPAAPQRQPTIQEIYDDLKMTDEVHVGAYANAVLMSHGASEFTFDFITRFFPNAAVSARVFMAAPQVPKLLESLTVSMNRYRQRVQAMGQQGGGEQGQGPQEPPGM